MSADGGVLVLGGSGNIGRALIDALAAAGQRIKAAGRDPARLCAGRSLPGDVQPVRLDLRDPTTFDDALAGVDRMFVLSPGNVVDSDDLVAAFLELALPRVRRVVTLTAQGIDASDQIPHRKLELRVERSSATWTHLRPTWFADNFHTYWLQQVRSGQLLLPAALAKTAFIDVRDIAACACRLFVEAGYEHQALVLTGPDALDYHAAARVLSEATGRSLAYTPCDDATFLANAIAQGVPVTYAHMITSLFGMVRAGVTAEVNVAVEALTGRRPRSLLEYARTYAHALRG